MSGPLDDALDALAHVQRRRLLTALLERESRSASAVVAPGDEAGNDRHAVAMRHTHIPKLDAYGFVDWDRDRDEVLRGPKFDDISPMLELLVEHEDELPGGWLGDVCDRPSG